MAEIRVIEQNGQPIGWSASLFRNLLRYADNFLVVGMVVMLIDNKERRLGDLAAGTLVIRERKPDMTDSAIKINPRVANKPELAAMDVGLVSPVEYDLLADYLKRRKSLTKQSRPLVAQTTLRPFPKQNAVTSSRARRRQVRSRRRLSGSHL